MGLRGNSGHAGKTGIFQESGGFDPHGLWISLGAALNDLRIIIKTLKLCCISGCFGLGVNPFMDSNILHVCCSQNGTHEMNICRVIRMILKQNITQSQSVFFPVWSVDQTQTVHSHTVVNQIRVHLNVNRKHGLGGFGPQSSD